MRQVLPRWCEEGSCGRAVMAMFQVSRTIWSLYISPANRNEELPNSQFNLSFNLPCLMLLEKMTHLCVSLYSLVPLLPKVSNGVWRSPFCQPLLSLLKITKGLLILPIKILFWRTVLFWVWNCSHRYPFSASSYTHLTFITLPCFLIPRRNIRNNYLPLSYCHRLGCPFAFFSLVFPASCSTSCISHLYCLSVPIASQHFTPPCEINAPKKKGCEARAFLLIFKVWLLLYQMSPKEQIRNIKYLLLKGMTTSSLSLLLLLRITTKIIVHITHTLYFFKQLRDAMSILLV